MSFGPDASYTDIFAARGALYHQAMRRFPEARDEEFAALVRVADIRDGERICDAPAGGGYLARHLPSGCELCYVENAAAFLKDCTGEARRHMVLGRLDALPLGDGCRDHVVSLAGLHHVADKAAFFRQAARVLRPGGVLTCADVWHDSPVRRFLDDFVGAHNETGHSGWYFDEATAGAVAAGGFRDVQVERIAFAWRFAHAADLPDFCALLFGMDAAGRARIGEAARTYLGAADARALPWELCFVRAVR